MKRGLMIALPVLGALALLAAANAVYAVGQAEQAVLLRLGRPITAVNGGPAPTEAGLHLKWPFIDQVAMLDRRPMELQSPAVEGPASVTPTAFRAEMRYRITDPLRFYRALGDDRQARRRLLELLQGSFEPELSGSGAQALAQGPAALDGAVADTVRSKAAGLGLRVFDARVVVAAPSPSTIEALSQRMQDAAVRQVAQIKADSEQHRRDLLAQADRDAADVRGEGERQALAIRGDGDAQRAAILGEAYGQDPDFARFFRRLEAYDQAFNPDNTILVLSQDNAFLDLFGHGPKAEEKAGH